MVANSETAPREENNIEVEEIEVTLQGVEEAAQEDEQHLLNSESSDEDTILENRSDHSDDSDQDVRSETGKENNNAEESNGESSGDTSFETCATSPGSEHDTEANTQSEDEHISLQTIEQETNDDDEGLIPTAPLRRSMRERTEPDRWDPSFK